MIKSKKLELIDREAFVKVLMDEMRAEHGLDLSFDVSIPLFDLICKIYSFPLINEQLAEWIENKQDGWHCSWCLVNAPYDASGARVRTKHCPNCGRRMRR